MLLVAAVGWFAPGCASTVLKEGAGVALGATGLYVPIKPLSELKDARPLGDYKCFELGEIKDDVGGRVPAEVMERLGEQFVKQLGAKKLPNDLAGKTLLVRGVIIHYEDRDMLAFSLGPLEEIVARIELVDKAGGRVLGVANCVGRTETRTTLGPARKAEGLAKAIVAWIAANYPKKGPEEVE